MTPAERIFVAIDMVDVNKAVSLAARLKGRVGGFKIGKEFFTAQGPEGVRRITALGVAVFLDLKFHDIPNTVARAVHAALPLAPFMLNVHASGGAEMMRAAASEAAKFGPGRPMMLAVTVLTSLGEDDLSALGVEGGTKAQVRRLAALAKDSGMDGVVCSPREIEVLRADLGPDFKLVTPGIRPEWSAKDDQARVLTPVEALKAGADYLVIGRPITKAADPAEAARRIAHEILETTGP